jgi:hypothetical protein
VVYQGIRWMPREHVPPQYPRDSEQLIARIAWVIWKRAADRPNGLADTDMPELPRSYLCHAESAHSSCRAVK